MKPNEVIVRTAEFEQKVVESEEGSCEFLSDQLVAVDLSTPDGVDAAQFIMERTELVAEAWAKKAKHAQRVARELSRANEKMKGFIKELMLIRGVTELQGNETRYKLSKTKAKLVVEDESKLIDAYEKIVREVDTARLREDLELGVPVDGAKLEPSYALRPYPQKKALGAA